MPAIIAGAESFFSLSACSVLLADTAKTAAGRPEIILAAFFAGWTHPIAAVADTFIIIVAGAVYTLRRTGSGGRSYFVKKKNEHADNYYRQQNTH